MVVIAFLGLSPESCGIVHWCVECFFKKVTLEGDLTSGDVYAGCTGC